VNAHTDALSRRRRRRRRRRKRGRRRFNVGPILGLSKPPAASISTCLFCWLSCAAQQGR
jgi:hypothetical protein